MCFHKRILFACSHYAWLTTPEATIPCEVERRFLRGGMPESDNDNEHETMSETGGGFDKQNLLPEEGCNQMWSHGFHTVKVGEDCRSCVYKRRRKESMIGEVKEVIKSLRVNLERITTGAELGQEIGDEENNSFDEEDDWGLTVRSKNSDSTRNSAGTTGLELTSSPGGSSETTDTGDTSLSLDGERDHGLVKEPLLGSDDGDDDDGESEHERMEEAIMKRRDQMRKSELFVDGMEIASAIPGNLRREWRERWRETGSCGYEHDYNRKLMTGRREPLLPMLVSIRRRRQTLLELGFTAR
ncbi:putative endonuclease lcl3 [Podospora pseudopauciseta]|uniref:Endonuclease lcl3 n=1 Tax=Podospora pseudopauciseta TaxID=2093780 RepID=A0ABR0I192_9PEZI|nr:putative endonuclease lcl3 [Podospora pseudopauciseta]